MLIVIACYPISHEATAADVLMGGLPSFACLG